MNESPGSFESLSSRVDELEKRVHALEHPDEEKKPALNYSSAAAGAVSADDAASFQAANLFPILGRAMLGIAGAYVLRAIAEAGLMPKAAVAALAIVYALAWLVWAARVSRASGFVPLVYAGTSAVILVPMLWEETLHFHVLAPIVTACVLAVFVALATLLEWNRNSSQVLWLTYSAAAATAITLSVATHAMLPFVFTLLLIVLLCEVARTLGHTRTMWPFAALIADAAIWGMIFIYGGPQNARAEYPELSIFALVLPACLLFAINATGVVTRAILVGTTISTFEIVQFTIAFGLGVCSVLFFAPAAAVALGITCLIMSAAAYFASFQYLRHRVELRNFYLFSIWSAVLLVAGSMWALPHTGACIALASAGLLAYIAAARVNSTTIGFHGAVFLCTGSIFAGVAPHVFNALVASMSGRAAMPLWVIAFSSVAAYAVGSDSKDDGWALQTLHLVPAFISASMISALLVYGTVALATLATALDVHHIAFLRTLVISAVALGLAYTGSRWGRVAMTRLAYAALVFVAAKLLFEDLRYGHMEFIAGSIFLFAITLIAVPRLVRLGANSRTASRAEIPVHIEI